MGEKSTECSAARASDRRTAKGFGDRERNGESKRRDLDGFDYTSDACAVCSLVSYG